MISIEVFQIDPNAVNQIMQAAGFVLVHRVLSEEFPDVVQDHIYVNENYPHLYDGKPVS